MAAFATSIRPALSHLRLVSSLPPRRQIAIRFPPSSNPMRFRSAVASSRFVWNDVQRAVEEFRDGDVPSDLRRYFDRVRACNRGSEMKSEFVTFVIENQIVGYIHKDFINHLLKFRDIFTYVRGDNGSDGGCHITLHSSLKTPEDRTGAVGDVIMCLGELIPAIPCNFIIWDAYILLSRACNRSLLGHKGIWCPYERLCRKGWREISLDRKKK